MRLRLLVVRDAEDQIRQAAEWWYANRPAARRLFRQELARGFDLITTQPEIGTKALDVALLGLRRLHLFRIHYFRYYRVLEGSVEVLALWHTRRAEPPPF